MNTAELLSKPTLSVQELARVLSLSRSGAYDACRRGEIEHLKFGSRIVIPTVVVLRLLGLESEENEERAELGPAPTPQSTDAPTIRFPNRKRDRYEKQDSGRTPA